MADTGHLKTQAHEAIKSHSEFDAQNRLEYMYIARADAEDGAPCGVTRYSYDLLSSRVVFMKEYESAWDATWDLF